MRRFLLLLFMASPFALFAQPKVKFRSTPSVKFVVEQVARDFYQNFNNIKGDTLNVTGGAIEFTSKVVPVGALSTSITNYVDPNSYSWQSTLFKSEEYEAAVEKYNEYSRQINGAT